MFDDDDKSADMVIETSPKRKRVRLRLSDVLKEPTQRRSRSNEAVKEPHYKVGYKRPPLHTRFKKGQSGNPSGKRKADGGVDVRTLVQDTFLAKVKVREAGKKPKRIPKIVALIKQRQQEAVKDSQAFREVIRIGEKFGVFNVVRKPKRKTSQMTAEQREAAAQAYLLLRKAGLTREDD